MERAIKLIIFLAKAGVACMCVLVGVIMYFAIDALIKML